MQSLYVNRPLLNAQALLDWASQQGFCSTLKPDDMHVTIAFSKKPLSWDRLTPLNDDLHIKGGDRDICPLGDKGAIVLRFENSALHRRWEQFCTAGASWDHPDYHPHITLTYADDTIQPDSIEPYSGPLIFGPEIFEPLDEHWNEKIKEVPLVVENNRVLFSDSTRVVKYPESITETNIMTELSTLLMKNIDLILEAYNVNPDGSLVEVNKKKVVEADEVFHQYFVKSMNKMFRQINEDDPIMHQPNSMGMPGGHNDLGMMGDGHGGEMMGMSPGSDMHSDMHMGGRGDDIGMNPHERIGMDSDIGMQDDMMGGDMDPMGGDQMGGRMPNQMHGGGSHNMGGGMGGGGMSGGFGESTEGAEYNWLFNENIGDVDINEMFDISEEDEDVEEGEEVEEGDEGDQEVEESDEELTEFAGMGMGQDDDDDQYGMGGGMGGGDMGGGMAGGDMGGGMGGDMGGMDDMGGDNGNMGGMDDPMGGGDGDMVTIHGTTDNGGDFEFSFDPDTLGFGGDEGGEEEQGQGHDDMGPGDLGNTDEPGMGDEHHDPQMEAAGRKPGKGPRGPRTSKMNIVPANRKTSGAAPFPTPMGTGGKKR